MNEAQSMQSQIKTVLENTFSPIYMDIINESQQHNVPPNSETHFCVYIVSNIFNNLLPVKRHQLVYQALKEEMQKIHALALHTYTKAEWEKLSELPNSPNCLGGGKSLI